MNPRTTAESTSEATQEVMPQPTAHEYIVDGQNYAIAKRLSDLLKPSSEDNATRVQTAAQGTEYFTGKHFNESRLGHPEISIQDVKAFIIDILMYSPNMNGDGSSPVILDDVLNELITQMGDDFQNARLSHIIQIANGTLPSEVSVELAYAIFAYVSYWSGTHRDEFPYLYPIEGALDDAIRAAEISDPDVKAKLDKFHNMTWQYGRVE